MLVSRLAAVLVCGLMPAGGAVAAPASTAPTEAVRQTLRDALSKEGGVGKGTRFAVAFADLDGDSRPEAIVYLSGPAWCGSGGCRTMVLTPRGSTYAVVMAASVTRLPIRVLPSVHNGWHDIGVDIAGGGGPSASVALPFDGQRYPETPFASSAERLKLPQGRVVISLEGTNAPL